MIPINARAVYDEALKILKQAGGHGFRGRAAQIFLACKHYGNQIPTIGSVVGIDSSQLQELLDDLYRKPSRTSADKIAIIFDEDHKVPTGTTGGILSGPSNIWRNNLNLQKGFICYASVSELQNPAFLTSSRKACPHLQPSGTTTLAQSWCIIKGAPPTYRGEDNPKMFRKDPLTGDYTVHDPQDVAFYSGIIRPATGVKLPIAALIIAIYYDSFLSAGRNQVDVGDFLSDFGFTAAEAAAYFDDDPASVAHSALALVAPGISWTRLPTASIIPAPSVTLPGLPPLPVPRSPAGRRARTVPPPASTGTTTSPPPPTASGWWDAEQAVNATLTAAGWNVSDATRNKFGYDLKIVKHATVKVVEVKSSVGICAPTLTKLEHDQAKLMRTNYILAIVENFKSSNPAIIQWVEDPASLQMTEQKTVEYRIPRSVWRTKTRPIP